MVTTGARNEDDSRLAARKVAKIVKKLGADASFKDFRIQNIVGTGGVAFPIRLEGLADEHGKMSSVSAQYCLSCAVCAGGRLRVRTTSAVGVVSPLTCRPFSAVCVLVAV